MARARKNRGSLALLAPLVVLLTLAGCRGILGIDTDRTVSDDSAETGATDDGGNGATRDAAQADVRTAVDGRDGDPNAIGFRGQYGFLVDYACTDEVTARARIDTMVDTFGIREVQFYDWFASYSQPTAGAQWMDPWFHTRTICLQTIEWYIDELHARGGRAWAYVQSILSESALTTDEAGVFKLLDPSGSWYYVGTHPAYFANGGWATHQVNVWGQAIASLHFDGIHWDTVGPVAGDPTAETTGFHEFLATAKVALEKMGLRQTMNFVNVSWWDESLLAQIELPYFEVWSKDVEQLTLFPAMSSQPMQSRKAVMAFYPSVDTEDGGTQSSTMIDRWKDAPQHNLHYLVVGDGTRRLVNEYFPTSIPMTQAEIDAMKVLGP